MDFPEDLRTLWESFNELRLGADEGMNGLRISWSAIHSWSTFTGQVPTPRECQALFYLDAVVRNPEPE